MIFAEPGNLLLLLLNIIVSVVWAESDGYFIVPPAAQAAGDYKGNKVYFVGEAVQLQWTTDLSSLSLLLWQQNNNTSATIFQTSPNQNTFQWQVSLSYTNTAFNLTPSGDIPGNIFFFAMYNESATDFSFTSHYFNISADPAPSSTTAPVQISTPTSTPTIVASRSASPQGLTAGQQAGIGVGVSAAGLLGLTALTWFLWHRKPAWASCGRERKPVTIAGPEYVDKKAEMAGQGCLSEMPGHMQSELPANRMGQELP